MDEEGRTIVSSKMAIEENSMQNRLKNRNRRTRSGGEVSAPSQNRTVQSIFRVCAHRAYYS
jgi:hypothetical protein